MLKEKYTWIGIKRASMRAPISAAGPSCAYSRTMAITMRKGADHRLWSCWHTCCKCKDKIRSVQSEANYQHVWDLTYAQHFSILSNIENNNWVLTTYLKGLSIGRNQICNPPRSKLLATIIGQSQGLTENSSNLLNNRKPHDFSKNDEAVPETLGVVHMSSVFFGVEMRVTTKQSGTRDSVAACWLS